VLEELGTPNRIGQPAPLEPKAAPEPASTTIGGASFYGAKQEQKANGKPAQQKSTTGGAGSKYATSNIYPVEALSPYAHKWTIKARVSQKSTIRTWHKPSGEGKLFSVNLLDESGEIKATAFGEQVDALYDVLQEGSVYYISTPCKVAMAKKQFTNLPHEYELTFESGTVIEKAEDQTSVPQVRYNFSNIQELQEVEKDATVDLIGVLKEVDEVSQITSKTTGKGYEKRELTVVDDTGFSVRVTVWGKTATSFDAQPESVIAFKGVKVSDFGGRSLSLLSSGTVAVDPDIPDAHRLKGWYDASGRTDTFATHANLSSVGAATGRKDQDKTILQVKEEGLGMETTDYFTVKATIVHIRPQNWAYAACRSEGCNKKVTDMNDGTWRCERCNVSHERPEYRYIMQVNVCDHSGQMWLSCFDDVGRIIMGMSADELTELTEEDEAKRATAFEDANCRTLSFRCRAKMDTYQDEPR
jgi:replication factor A1